MTLEKNWSGYRLTMIILMYITTFLFSIFLYLFKFIELNKFWMILVVSVLSITLILLNLELARIEAGYINEKLHNFGMIFLFYTLCMILLLICTVLKLTIIPIAITGIIFTFITNRNTGIYFVIYFSVLYYIIYEPSYTYLIYYITTSILVCIINEYFLDKKSVISSSIICISTHFILFTALEYFSTSLINYKSIVISLICGIIVAIFGISFSYFVKYFIINKPERVLTKMCEEDYKLLSALRNKSEEEYMHCKKTAILAEAAAIKIGADSLLSKAGGYYCHISNLVDDKNINNNVSIGEYYHFPHILTELIIQAVAGKDDIPKSREAAIVMLADTCISAFDQIDSNAGRAGWNKEIVIQQIFNAKSNEGLLEESGITMKMYLDLKDCFSNECSKL